MIAQGIFAVHAASLRVVGVLTTAVVFLSQKLRERVVTRIGTYTHLLEG